jgi:chromosome segregation ATPase
VKTIPLIALFATSLFLVGCGQQSPKKPPGIPTVTAAPIQESAKPAIDDSRKLAEEAAVKSAAARTRVDDAKAVVEAYKAKEYKDLKDLVTRLREQESATKSELDELYERITGAEARITRLIERLTEVQADLAAEHELRVKAAQKLAQAATQIAAKEAEADQLRSQLKDQKETTAVFERNAQENFEAAQKASAKADKMLGQRNLLFKFLVGAVIVAILSLVVNYIQFRT